MDFTKTLTDLRAERDRIDRAIAALEQLTLTPTTPKRRGRPPKWISKARSANTDRNRNDVSVQSFETA
jgi:hypothetical protein